MGGIWETHSHSGEHLIGQMYAVIVNFWEYTKGTQSYNTLDFDFTGPFKTYTTCVIQVSLLISLCLLGI